MKVKELPVCVSEHAFFKEKDWLKVGFRLLLQELAPYKRDYLLPRLGDTGQLENKIAE